MVNHPNRSKKQITDAEIMAAFGTTSAAKLNAREQLMMAAGWLGLTHEDLSFGLKSSEDGIKLWRYGQTRAEDTYADDWSNAELVRVLGYNPFKRCVAQA